MIYVPYWSATMEKVGVDNIQFLCDADWRFDIGEVVIVNEDS